MFLWYLDNCAIGAAETSTPHGGMSHVAASHGVQKSCADILLVLIAVGQKAH